MRKIVFTNDKGGVGKTTTVANLAVGAAGRGVRTLVVDMDPQADVTFTLLAQRPPEAGGGFIPPSMYALMMDHSRIERVILQAPNYQDLFVIPSNADLAHASLKIATRPTRLRKFLQELSSQSYDLILIDTGKGLDPLAVNALAAADEVIVMVSPGRLELDAIARMEEHVDLVRNELLSHSKSPKIRGILLTLADPYSITKDTLDRIHSQYPGQLLKTRIPKNNDLQKAIGRARSIFEVAPRSRGAEAYKQLIEELGL
jgi:chromosome partitioning protein